MDDLIRGKMYKWWICTVGNILEEHEIFYSKQQ